MSSFHRLLLSSCVLFSLVGLGQPGHADTITTPDGKTITIPDGMSPQDKAKMMERMSQRASSGGAKKPQPEGKKGDEAKKKDDKKKDGDKGKEEKKSETVNHPDKPKVDPDKTELEAMPKDGLITLQFEGHPWPAMIEWYSRATGRDISWQQLPSGYINLTTQRPFTMEETGDRLNQLLLAEGFTILDDGDFMQIVKTEGLNTAFVPRVKPQQLATLSPHSFVRVSFQLTRFKAEELAKELDAMKSKHGKLMPMTAANRIEAMDTVRNLRDIYFAIDTEQSSGSRAPREFEIQYLRADTVKKKLDEMFGGAAKGPQLTPQQIQQMQQQRRQQNNNQKKPPPTKNEEKPSIVVNELRNSIIVKAPPSIMIDIAAAVELLDVPLRRDTLDIKAYTLSTRSPSEVSEILNESGALSPKAIVRVDKSTRALLVSGTELDHLKIGELIDRIDGNARRFVSIRLRRYPALQVATTIESMMGKPKEDEKKSRRRSYFSYWDYGREEEEKNPNDVFRVTADVENNKLILKCNDTEYEMVMELLEQMGEGGIRTGFAANEIVVDGFEDEDALLDRVRKIFNASSENEVILPPPAAKPLGIEVEEESADDEEATEELNPNDVTMQSRELQTSPAVEAALATLTLPIQRSAVTLESVNPESAPRARRPIAKKAPPVIIRRNAQGKLVIQCDDPAALARFEEILRQSAPPTRDWVHFKLQHVTALWMKLQLQDFFDEEEDGNQSFFIWDYWGDDDKDEAPPGLGDEKKMRFIDDGESTLVVRNASARQLATVEQLIKLYDVAEPPNPQNARFKEIIQIQYSKPSVIAETLKDAFRDLLSSNDKAFAQQKNGEDGEGRSRRMGPFSFNTTTTSGLQGTSFKGKISFGIDDSTNRLVVTAEGKKLLEIIVDMVRDLDMAAMPKDDTRVVTVPAGLNSATVRETLVRMFGPDSVTVKPKDGNKNGDQPPQKPGEDNGRGRQGRNRDR